MRSLSLVRNAIALTALACLVCSPAAQAQILYQQPSNAGGGPASQTFPDNAGLTIYSFDNFTVTGNGWDITQVTAFGAEQGNSALNTAVSLAFTTSPNASAISTTYAGTEVNNNLVFTQPIHLNAGAYFLTAYVTRPSSAGQWFFALSTPVTGTSYYQQNPGGVFGLGTAPRQPDPNDDLAFQINGTLTPAAVPEPGSVALMIGLATTGAGFLSRRRRKVAKNAA